MVTGLSLYYPLHTGPVWDMRPYSFRSAMSPGIVIYTDTESPDFSTQLARQGIAELKMLRPLFLGDLYPLLPLTTAKPTVRISVRSVRLGPRVRAHVSPSTKPARGA